eukprot:TRINITY_DN11135_c0_g1_i1.p1 TRINITY_DN11135_c0_g1~~TRINITY_DN11135_c0_g1_i1.p1  ORF type:complete len:710 (-),score=144.09 TRINITY_DN11135_c0_g1_i1:188-2251(-)
MGRGRKAWRRARAEVVRHLVLEEQRKESWLSAEVGDQLDEESWAPDHAPAEEEEARQEDAGKAAPKTELEVAQERIRDVELRLEMTEKLLEEKQDELEMQTGELDEVTRQLDRSEFRNFSLRHEVDALKWGRETQCKVAAGQLDEAKQTAQQLQQDLADKARRLQTVTEELQQSKSRAAASAEDLTVKTSILAAIQQAVRGVHVRWYYKADGNRFAFPVEVQSGIEDAYQRDDTTHMVRSGHYLYEVNFQEMTQRNMQTKKVRPVERQEHQFGDSDPVAAVKTCVEASLQAKEDLRIERGELARVREELRRKNQELESSKQASRAAEAELEECQAAKGELLALKDWGRATEQQLNVFVNTLDTVRKERDAANEQLGQLQSRLLSLQRDLDKRTRTALEDKQAYQSQLVVLRSQRDAQGDKVAAMQKEKDGAERNASINLHKAMELLKRPPPNETAFRIEEPVSVRTSVQNLLRKLSHGSSIFNGASSRCHAFQNITVVNVSICVNDHLWQEYELSKKALQQRHERSNVSVKPLEQSAQPSPLDVLLPHARLDSSVNEVFLFHGCQKEAANEILEDGFDVRRAGTGGGSMYGQGLYFAREPCKSDQYTAQSNRRFMIVARVLLGDWSYQTGGSSDRLAPLRQPSDGTGGRYDSCIVNPNRLTNQHHWEYIVFRNGQAYPELLVEYTVP